MTILGAQARIRAMGCWGLAALLVLATGSAWSQPSKVPAFTSPVSSRGESPSNAAASSAPAVVGGEPTVVNMAMPSAIGADYKISPNDLLEIEIFGVKELNRSVRVNASGHITLPLIGALQVAGYSPSDAEALIAIQYGAKYLQDPQVSVFIKEFTTQRITVDGAVVKPGIYPLTGQITMLRALALAGGGAPMADLEQVMLFRITADGKSVSEKFNVEKMRRGEERDPMLQGDDVIVVNRNPTRTALRDSLFRDIIDTLNPFSQSYQNVR